MTFDIAGGEPERSRQGDELRRRQRTVGDDQDPYNRRTAISRSVLHLVLHCFL
jgi:hypothetical protein